MNKEEKYIPLSRIETLIEGMKKEAVNVFTIAVLNNLLSKLREERGKEIV